MKAIVVYQSKYGATSKYAQWIGSELNFPVFETEELDPGQLTECDLVILGSSVYIGKLLMKKWLKKNLKSLWNKKIFLFVVSGTPLNQREKLDSYIRASVPAETRNLCDIYFLPGRMVMKELSIFDRFMLKMGARMAKSETEKKTMLTDYNDIKKEHITELLNAVKKAAMRIPPNIEHIPILQEKN
jgi:menaquinone-dependent protoporphyrinogen IX oxidase